jgi:RAP domain
MLLSHGYRLPAASRQHRRRSIVSIRPLFITSPWLSLTVSAATRRWTAAGFGCCIYSTKQPSYPAHACRSFSEKSPHWDWNIVTVSDILDDYMQNHANLDPSQVSAVWNKLGKAVQKSRKFERQTFWIDHHESLKTLIDQIIRSANQFDGRSTATVTHGFVKILHCTRANSLGDRQPLWDALQQQTVRLIQADGFDAHSLSNLIWSYAKVNDGIITVVKVDRQLLTVLAETAEFYITEFSPQGLANVAWAFAKLNHKAPFLFKAIADRGRVVIYHFKAQELSTISWAFAKQKHNAPPLFYAIAKAAPALMSDFSPQEVSNISWAFATMNHNAPELFDSIAKAATVRIGSFNPQGLTNTALAFATMNHNAPELFDSIAKAATARMGEFSPQALCNTALAFAKLNYEAESLFNAIAEATQVRINEFNPLGLANIAGAFATLNHAAPSMFDDIASAAQVRIKEFSSHQLAKLAWAFATLNQHAESLFDAIASVAKVRIKEFSPHQLAKLAWSFATLNQEAESLFDAVARFSLVCIDDFNSQDLSRTAWAFAALSYDAPALFDAIATTSQGRIREFSPHQLADTAWAFATLNHEAPSLFDAIAARAALMRIHDFSPQAISQTAVAFAMLNHEAKSMFDAIAKATEIQINDFNPQELANTAWSFAVFDAGSSSFTHPNSPFGQALRSMDPSIFLVEELYQLHQVSLWCQEQTGATCSWYPVALSQQCRDVFVSTNNTNKVAPSLLQNDVVEALRKLQDVSHVEVDFSTPKSGYSLDAVVTFRGERIGVEVDEPFQFAGRSQIPNGSTILKRRQVRALESLKLVSVPYWEWEQIFKQGSNNKERSEKKLWYLLNLLEEALVGSK